MRAITSTERALIAARHLNVHHRTLTVDADGQWRNLSALAIPGAAGVVVDFVTQASGSEALDQPVAQATITLRRDVTVWAPGLPDGRATFSLAPTMEGSLLNRTAAGTFAPLVDIGRLVRQDLALTQPGVLPVEADWRSIFLGVVDDIGWAGDDAQVPVTCRDIGALLLDAQIKVERVYGTEAGTPLAEVLRGILDDNGFAGVPLVVPTDPGWMVQPFTQTYGSVLTALRDLAAQIGWDVRYTWRGASGTLGTFDLVLTEPDRAKTTPDAILGPDEHGKVAELKLTGADIRNLVKVSFRNRATGLVDHVFNDPSVVGNSVARYGERYMEIAEDETSAIDSPVEAQRMADAAARDLAFPPADRATPSVGFWPAQIGDLHEYLPDGELHDTAQRGAVVGITWEATAGHYVATFKTRGSPAGAYRSWLLKAGPTTTAPAASGARCNITAEIIANPPGSPYEDPARWVTVGWTVTPSWATVTLAGFTRGTLGGFDSAVRRVYMERPLAGDGPGSVTLQADLAGYISDTDAVTIPEQGKDTVPSRVRIDVVDTTPTALVVRVASSASVGVDGHVEVATSGAPVTQPGGATLSWLRVSTVPGTNTGTGAGGLPYGIDFVIPRPAFGGPAARVIFTVTPEDARIASDSDAIDVPARDYEPGAGVTDPVALDAFLSALPGGYDVAQFAAVTVLAKPDGALVSLESVVIGGGGGLVAGPPVGEWDASGSVWIFKRPALGAGLGRVRFAGALAGHTSDTDSVALPEIGRDTVPLRARLRLVQVDPDTVDLELTAASKFFDADATGTVEAQGLGAAPGWVVQSGTTTAGAPHLRTSTIPGYALGASGPNALTYAVVLRVNRPPFGAGNGRLTVTVTPDAAGDNLAADADAFEVPAKDYVPAQVPALSASWREELSSSTTFVVDYAATVTPLSALVRAQYRTGAVLPLTGAWTDLAAAAAGRVAGTHSEDRLEGARFYLELRAVSADGTATEPAAARFTVPPRAPVATASSVEVASRGFACVPSTNRATIAGSVTMSGPLPPGWTMTFYTPNGTVFGSWGSAAGMTTFSQTYGGDDVDGWGTNSSDTITIGFTWSMTDAAGAYAGGGGPVAYVAGFAHSCTF